jgi:uncharacterized membrane protein
MVVTNTTKTRQENTKVSTVAPRNGFSEKIGMRISLIVAIVAICTGVVVRTYRLDYKSLWLDEIYTLFPLYSTASFERLFSDFLIHDQNAPLFSFILLGWTELFGYSDAIVRSPSLLFGILAILSMYLMLRWVFNPNVAVTGTILIAFSWPAIYYAQELRSYSLLLFVSVLVTGIWLRIITQEGSGKPAGRAFWLLLLMSPVLSYVHLYGFILAASLWLHLGASALLVRDNPGCRRAALGLGVTCLMFIPWISMNLIAAAQAGFLHLIHIESPGVGFFVDMGAFMYHHPVPALLLALLPIAFGGRAVARKIGDAALSRNLREPFLAIVCVTVLPFLAVFLFSQVKPILYTRYLMPFVPAAIIFIALAYENSSVSVPWKRHIALLVAALMTLPLILPDHYELRWKPQNREAVQWILDRYKPAHDAIIVPCVPEPTFSCSYETGILSARVSRYVHYLNFQTLPDLPIRPDFYSQGADVGGIISRYQDRKVKVVFLLGSRKHLEALPAARKVIEMNGFRCREQVFFLSTVYQCNRDY